MHVSPNRLEGSLFDTSLDRLLAACRRHAVTGEIRISNGPQVGVVELRAGAIDKVAFGAARGARALELLAAVGDGDYELVQRLPDGAGALGPAAAAVADHDMILADVRRHCERHGLTCAVHVDGDHGILEFRAGAMVVARAGGRTGDAAVRLMESWLGARIELAVPALDLDIEGWPVTSRAPTTPFTLQVDVPARMARGTGPVDHLRAGAVGVPASAPPRPAPSKLGNDDSGRRKATLAAPAPPPQVTRPAMMLPRPRQAIPPATSVAAAEPVGPAAPPMPWMFERAHRSAEADAGDYASVELEIEIRGDGRPRRAGTQPRMEAARRPAPARGGGSRQRKGTRSSPPPKAARAAKPARAVTPQQIIEAAIDEILQPAAVPRAIADLESAPVAIESSVAHPSSSDARVIAVRQQVAASAYRSSRPVAAGLRGPAPVAVPLSRRRAATRMAVRTRWAPIAITLLALGVTGAIALAALGMF